MISNISKEINITIDFLGHVDHELLKKVTSTIY